MENWKEVKIVNEKFVEVISPIKFRKENNLLEIKGYVRFKNQTDDNIRWLFYDEDLELLTRFQIKRESFITHKQIIYLTYDGVVRYKRDGVFEDKYRPNSDKYPLNWNINFKIATFGMGNLEKENYKNLDVPDKIKDYYPEDSKDLNSGSIIPPKEEDIFIPEEKTCDNYFLKRQKTKDLNNEICLEEGWYEPTDIFNDGFEILEPIFLNEYEKNKFALKGKIKFNDNSKTYKIIYDKKLEDLNIYLQKNIEIFKSSIIMSRGEVAVSINSKANLEISLNTITLP